MPHNLTSHYPISSPTVREAEAKEDASRIANCKAQRGTWDAERRTCILPTIPRTWPKPQEEERKLIGGIDRGTGSALDLQIQQQAAQEPKGGFGVLKDAETGRLTGFTRGDRTLLGLSPKEVRSLAEGEARLQELEIGGQAEQVLTNIEEQEAGLRAAAGIEQTPFDQIARTEQIKLDYMAAALSAIPGIVPDFLGSLTSVAAGREILSGTLGKKAVAKLGLKQILKKVFLPLNIAIAVGASLTGFYRDFISDLESQRAAAVEATIRTISETKPLIGEVINAQNANPQDREAHIREFEFLMQEIQDDYDNLKGLTDSDLTALLGVNGINQLKEYRTFYRGEAQRLELEFQDALANPDPSKMRVTTEDVEAMKRRMARELLNA